MIVENDTKLTIEQCEEIEAALFEEAAAADGPLFGLRR